MAQDQQISQLKQALAEVQTNQQQLRADTEQGFAQVEARDKQMQQAIGQVRSELGKSFNAAIDKQSQRLGSTLDDLKALMLAKPKRARAGPDDEDMEG